AAALHAPVTVVAAPDDCAFQFDPVGKAQFISSCDIARNGLTTAGVPYTHKDAAPGSYARIEVGTHDVDSPDGRRMSKSDLADAKANFKLRLTKALTAEG